jgi:hypothetical protein
VVRPPATDRGRALFVVACLTLLVGGLLSLLMINTALAQGSFTLHDLQETSGELTDQQQALQQDIDVQAAPARLAKRAKALGMVPSTNAAFLRLSDGKVLGVAQPAPTPTPHTVKATASASPSATASPTSSGQATTGKSAKGTGGGAKGTDGSTTKTR